jgi:uncharacterized protein YggU (UPF0235/DUF167 family)
VVISQVRDPFEHTIMWHVSTATVSVRVQARALRRGGRTPRRRARRPRVGAGARRARDRAVCRLLAKRLSVAPSRVTIVRGAHSREKVIEVDGLDQATVEAALRQ